MNSAVSIIAGTILLRVLMLHVKGPFSFSFKQRVPHFLQRPDWQHPQCLYFYWVSVQNIKEFHFAIPSVSLVMRLQKLLTYYNHVLCAATHFVINCVLFFYCYITECHKFNSLNHTHLLSHRVCVSEFRAHVVWCVTRSYSAKSVSWLH